MKNNTEYKYICPICKGKDYYIHPLNPNTGMCMEVQKGVELCTICQCKMMLL